MSPLVQDEHHRIECVLGEELSPSDNDCNEAQWIGQIANQIAPSSVADEGTYGGHSQRGKSHGDAARNAGKSELDERSTKFVARIFQRALENLIRSETAGFYNRRFAMSCHSVSPVSKTCGAGTLLPNALATQARIDANAARVERTDFCRF